MDSPHHTPPHEAVGRDIDADVRVLRGALAAHGITLPSLGVDPLTLAGGAGQPQLVALGNCNAATARRLADVLRTAAEA
ncbi:MULTISPECIES: hypothetical protein [unclassified Streptomyces]|uniref:hypothetical protein n=1 Tax=unclassified Streptomyces TaxID=2593676 RepID=UPI0036FF06AF